MEKIYVVTHLWYEICDEETDAIASTEVFTDLAAANKFYDMGLALNPFLKKPDWFHHAVNRAAGGIETHQNGRSFRHRLYLMQKTVNPEPEKFF